MALMAGAKKWLMKPGVTQRRRRNIARNAFRTNFSGE